MPERDNRTAPMPPEPSARGAAIFETKLKIAVGNAGGGVVQCRYHFLHGRMVEAMKRKLPACLLSLALALSLLPAPALAAGARYEVLLEPSLQFTTMVNEWETVSGGIHEACEDVIVVTQTNKGNSPMGLMNTKGEMLVDYGVYDRIYGDICGYLCVEKGGKDGIIDTSGKVVIPLGTYGWVFPAGENRFRVNVGEEYGIIDAAGNYIVPLGAYEYVGHDPSSPGVLTARTGEGAFLLDLDGNRISDTYKQINSADEHGNFPVQFLDGSYGMIDP